MREILFRAKAINRKRSCSYRTKYKNGDWVYGLIDRPYKEDFPSLPMTMRNVDGISDIDVDYKTLGQFTGLLDNKGNKIFDGDVVVNSFERKFLVDLTTLINGVKLPSEEYREIIGNIHDNPELLDKE